ncbi:hypothetical protein [Thiothrix subterranea]|uniref:hypothetical protein n=1 Tax=Thiothrix subterranea TaxID=2735563 RepID=UPI00280B91FE|nr:hypothetical protein [Thiothrix subterranea]
MATMEMTAQDFEDTITTNDIVVIDFWHLGVGRAGLSPRFLRKCLTTTLTLCLRK